MSFNHCFSVTNGYRCKYMRFPIHGNPEKSANHPLTENPTPTSIENVPGNDTGHNFKQTQGGKVKTTQPPDLSGFFMPATSPCDCNKLPGVARNRKPPCGNTCSVTLCTLEGSRQPQNCQHFKQTNEVNAMQCTQPHAIGAPAPMDKGFTPTPTGKPCLLDSQAIINAIRTARSDHATKGRGNAYAHLLELFHQAIFPAFFVEAKGNLSEVSRLTGVNRETIRIWCRNHNIDMSGASVGGAV